MLKTLIYTLLILLIANSCYKEIIVYDAEPDIQLRLPSLIQLDGKDVFTDFQMNSIRFPVHPDSAVNFSAYTSFNEESMIWFEGKQLINNKVNHFGKVETGNPYSVRIEYKGEIKDFEFVFTSLPVIQIITDAKIWDEPKSLARVTITAPHPQGFRTSYAGVEYRGQSSRYLDKKSIGFTLWKGMSGDSEYEERLLGFDSNTDWILNGAAIDPSGIRNLVSMEIWRNMDNLNDDERTFHPGAELQLVELFINNSCRGYYVFSEHVNHKFLDAVTGDVLYKGVDWAGGATKFENYDPKVSENCFWNGWEQVVPDCSSFLNWKPLSELYSIACTTDDNLFRESIGRCIDVNNFIDYYLMLNLVFAGDNTGKNIFLYKNVRDDKFQIIPWDLDGSWGISYDGSPVSHEGVLTNALFDRLLDTNPDDYRLKVRNRWRELRESVFSEEQLNSRFDIYFRMLDESGIAEADNLIWGKDNSTSQQQAYIKDWLAKRLNYLDNVFSNYE